MEMTKRELFNAKSASTSLKDVVGEVLEISKIGFDKQTIEGQEKEVCYLIGTDGKAYCTISEVFIKSANDLAELLAEEGTLEIAIEQGVSNSGRNYVYARAV